MTWKFESRTCFPYHHFVGAHPYLIHWHAWHKPQQMRPANEKWIPKPNPIPDKEIILRNVSTRTAAFKKKKKFRRPWFYHSSSWLAGECTFRLFNFTARTLKLLKTLFGDFLNLTMQIVQLWWGKLWITVTWERYSTREIKLWIF